MESELSIEDALAKQCEILDRLQLETIFIKSRNNLTEDVLFIQESAINLSSGLSLLKKQIDRLKENNSSCQKLLSLYQKLNEKILHMYENIPAELETAYVNIDENESIETNGDNVSHLNGSSQLQSTKKDRHKNADFSYVLDDEESTIKDCKKALFNEPDNPKLLLLTKEEFNKVPKYMIGRYSLQMVNSLVNSINQVLKAKYSLLSAGKAAARKKGELDLYLHYKKQDIICENSGCKYFFTAEDYEKYIKTKLDRIALKLIMVLRHCKRIREYRLKKELYYIVLS
ncbi:hypothetical protein KPH14_005641 [Odynerus spinipes]|uniref:SKA complex subunit 1 n=1 Tax=Odynerus spinipes TaxID=1348599 RepID=A0AAD9VJR2_9HYME|nr:hypothetical protein KPH14_005641 [Odynerus spinipes]